MEIRYANTGDIKELAEIEAECFPKAEAATAEEIETRVKAYGDHFWLLEDAGEIIAFVDGMVTNEADLRDEMYANAQLHEKSGAWQMIFGVNTRVAYRRHGYAGMLIERAIADARAQRRKGLVLTCKDELVHYYAKFGFVNEGKTEKSTHGNVAWNQMRLIF